MGHSGMPAPAANESRFVADDRFGEYDKVWPLKSPTDTVTVSILTDRVVGAVDADGFLEHGQQHIEQGTLAETLRLTIRANIFAVDFGGILGRDGVSVEVVLHKDTDREVSLGNLVGAFGSWQEYQLDVNINDVRFPADPCPAQDETTPCATDPEPAENKISFVFTFTGRRGANFEVDWTTLEPRYAPGLAWRPVLLVPGWRPETAAMGPGTAWADGLAQRDIGHRAVEIGSVATIRDNAGLITGYAADLCRRFGVQRINVVAHSKGGIDAREHVEGHGDVETLVMLATPNAGSFIADILQGAGAAFAPIAFGGYLLDAQEMTSGYMSLYNFLYVHNTQTAYVAVAGSYDSLLASGYGLLYGPNDEVVTVESVRALPYASGVTYPTATVDAISQGICRTRRLYNHSCLRFNTTIVDGVFPAYMSTLTAPPPAPRSLTAPAELRGLMSGGAPMPAADVTDSYTALVDAGEAAWFVLASDGDAVRMQLVSPGGVRIEAAAPQDAGMFWYTAHQIPEVEAGTWTIEVSGTETEIPSSSYAVTAHTQQPPGLGIALTGRVDDLCAVGIPSEIVATVTADGAPLTGSAVTATVVQPDGTPLTPIDLAEAGDGQHAGSFTASQVGTHSVVLRAEATSPAFARETPLAVSVVPATAAFVGEISDAGVDTDGDGRFDQLLVEVGVEVDVAAGYRLHGTLFDGSGATVEQVTVDVELSPGVQTVPLAFDGGGLFAAGADGPYLLDDLVLKDLATGIGLARGPAYTTAAYAHTDFERPLPLLLTGNVSDRGVHTEHMDRLPYEAMVVDVEVDLAVAAELTGTASLYAEDGTLVTVGAVHADLDAGVGIVEFRFSAPSIFAVGRAGPYTLRTLSLQGTAADGTPLFLREPDVVTVTQPYRLEDFAESPRFTVGGTVTGLIGGGQLELQLSCVGPPFTPETVKLRPGNGPFVFPIARLVSGNTYAVVVTQQPTTPAQICTITNSGGTVEDGNVTDITVTCT